ncbi:uncharacterized protein LOC144868093 [Branchiostoma floridae x Branchiostoma japonicum]
MVGADTLQTNHTETISEAIDTTPNVEQTQPASHSTDRRQPVPTRDTREVRVYTDSIWKAVDTSRMFPNRSTSKEHASTIDHATKKMERVSDPKTAYVILHVASNDLDNSQRDTSSVQDCLDKTTELISCAKTSFPNATIVLSQVLPRGHNMDSNVNKNIKDYNQAVLQRSKDDSKTLYVRHKKLSTTRQLYKRDGIHLDDTTGTSLLVADVKRTMRSAENRSTYSGSGTYTPPDTSARERQGPRQRQDRQYHNARTPQHQSQDRPTGPRHDAGSYPLGDWSRRPNLHASQIPQQKIMDIAYKLSEMLMNIGATYGKQWHRPSKGSLTFLCPNIPI